jgi:predicted DNA binding CopG/RHH family protein
MSQLFQENFFKTFLEELDETGRQLAARRKDAVITLRVNQQDLDQLKAMAQKYGVGYQTFISEVLRELVRNGGASGKKEKINADSFSK